MTPDAIQTRVLQCLRKVAPEMNPASLGPNDPVRQTLDIDSYDFLQFLVAVSDSVGVEVPEADYGKLTTLAEITAYFASRIHDARA